jgi:hypothetical protein
MDGSPVGSFALFRQLRELRGITPDVIPGRFRVDEYVHGDLNARITIDTAQGDPVHLSPVNSAERGAADTTGAQAPFRAGVVLRHALFAIDPRERSVGNFGVRGPGTAECLSAARAMTAPGILQRLTNFIANSTAEAAARYHHSAACAG